jgi:NADPH2:quinone reductase
MRAARISRLDGPDAVELAEVDEPQPTGDQLLVDVHAAGVAFPDVLLSRGEYQMKPELPFVPGAEVAGVVRSAPDGAPFRAGDRVAGFPVLGGFAETVVLSPVTTFALPDRVDFVAGAALPMNYLTMHFALVKRGNLQRGETVLVHGAAGGIGTATLQLAKVLGARTIAVVSSDEKAEVARRAGADEVVRSDGFRQAVADVTGGRGVDMVVDPVGGERFTDSLRSLATEGRLLVIGFTEGQIPTVKVNRLLLNNIAVVGVGWGAYWTKQPEFLGEQWRDLLPHLDSGALDPPISGTYGLDEVAAALRELDERRAQGKVVIRVR